MELQEDDEYGEEEEYEDEVEEPQFDRDQLIEKYHVSTNQSQF